MNVRAAHAQMEGLALMKLMDTIASAHLDTTTPIARMVQCIFIELGYVKMSIYFLEINECESSPCSNDATCSDEVNGYHCTCVPGYNNTHCQNGWSLHGSFLVEWIING